MQQTFIKINNMIYKFFVKGLFCGFFFWQTRTYLKIKIRVHGTCATSPLGEDVRREVAKMRRIHVVCLSA
jgi:hypothetical protein